ncbi:hypothetical protein [Streptomyces sp. NPDC005805]|uniref:hypothetical protein n=1 Tax=Streptomyces sp. NPDC005805 TaxID=3157068 RepID=UPI0033C7E880
MAIHPTAAALPDLVAELAAVRTHGLLGLRRLDIPVLRAASALRTGCGPGEASPGAVESLLREAVGTLGGGDLQAAAEHTFGLIQGTRERPAQDRRRRAAEVFRVSTDRFRKHHEKLVVAETAEAVLALCAHPGPAPVPPPAQPGTACRDAVPAARRAGAVPAPARDAADNPADDLADGGGGREVPLGPVDMDLVLAGEPVRITVHIGAIEFITGVDVLVSSENVYLEMSRTYRLTTSGALRRAAARKNRSGGILDDVLARELRDWMTEFASPGLPVAPGTVAATGPGELARHGVRRIYHAAVVTPRADGGYETTPVVITKSVVNVFEEAAGEQNRFEPPLASVCLPLLGAGRGGLDPVASLRAVLTGIGRARTLGPRREVHLVVRRPEVAARVLDALADHRAPAAG